MRKQLLLSALTILLLSINLISAVTIDLKETYRPGETLLATIQGNFIDALQVEQVYFYQDRIQIPLIYDLGKIQDRYYIYALLPNEEKNLSLIIKNAHYIENTIEYTRDLIKNFTVAGEMIDFSVSPGFIISNQDFEIRIQSKTKALTVSSDFIGEKQEVYVPEGQTKKIKFSIQNITDFTLTDLKISSDKTTYTIPTAILIEANKSDVIKSKIFRFSPSSRDIAVLVNSDRELKINLVNLGQADLENISFIIPEGLKQIVKIEPEELDLNQDESAEITLTIDSDKIGFSSNMIEAKADHDNEQISAFFELNMSVTENLTYNYTQEIKTCDYLGGEKCEQGKECEGQIIASLEGDCCIGDCKEKQESRWKYFWITLIILVLIGIGYLLYKRYKKPGKSASDILKQKQKSYEQRFEQREVRGKLTSG